MIKNLRGKKAMSVVVASVIMVALVIGLILVVWNVVNGLVNKELEETQSCFGIFGEVTLNHKYTCYNSSANELVFSLNIGDVEVNEVVVFIDGDGVTKSFNIKTEAQTIAYLKNYTSGTLIQLPDKNSGLTYRANLTGIGISSAPDTIKISPVMDNKQCDASDMLNQVDSCSSLA